MGDGRDTFIEGLVVVGIRDKDVIGNGWSLKLTCTVSVMFGFKGFGLIDKGKFRSRKRVCQGDDH